MSYSHTSSNDSSELPAPIPPVRDAAAAIPTGKGKYDSHRKRDTDFRKDKPHLTETLSVERWQADVPEFALQHYGHSWQTVDDVEPGIVESFIDNMKDMWQTNHRHITKPVHYAQLLLWVQDHVDHEQRDLELDAYNALSPGTVTQGSSTVHKVLLQFQESIAISAAHFGQSDTQKLHSLPRDYPPQSARYARWTKGRRKKGVSLHHHRHCCGHQTVCARSGALTKGNPH